MYLKLATIFIISCFVTSVISQWRYDDDDDECLFVPEKKIDQRISLQKCDEYKKFTYKEYYTTGSCSKQKSYICEVPTGLVSNGQECKENEFPHMAHVGYESNGVKRYTCGGTLISEFFVLTAAHCKSNKKGKAPNIVRLNSVAEISGQAIFRNIEEIIVHPDYKTSKANDLALLRLSMKVNFQLGKVRPACLWTKDKLENDTAMISTGWWGATDFSGFASEKLMKAKLDLVDIGKCQKALGVQNVLDEYHICTTVSTREGRDSCIEDSGGQLQVIQPDNPCMAHIIGVMSKGTACGFSNSIGVYVKVSKFIDWIENIVWNNV